jgi:hypothetical protein
MKTIATFILVLFIGVAAQAQNAAKEVKVATIEMGIVNATATATQEVSLKNTIEVARLYKRSDSKVKHALSFTTKRDAAKMA